jgi:hypothetical protein
VTANQQQPSLPLRAFATYRIFASAFNYTCFALVDVTFKSLLPVFFTLPLDQGGMGYPIRTTGVYLAVMGVMNALIQLVVFPRLHTLLGPRNLILTANTLSLFMFALCPIEASLANTYGQYHYMVNIALGVQFTLVGLMNMTAGVSHLIRAII